MGAIRQNLIFVIAIAGAVASSQLPEFAQQYRQRIGGVVEELGRTVDEFDRDAASNGLDRQQALELHARDLQPLFHARGKSMETSISRLDTLRKQQADFASAGPLTQPLILAYSDPNTL